LSQTLYARYIYLTTAVVLCLPAMAIAQVPSTADPSRIDQRLSTPSLDSGPAPLAAPSVTGPDVKTTVPDGAEKIVFALEGLNIQGNTIFSEADLRPIYAEKIGTDINLADMLNIADKITAKYRNAGYILTRAVVPEQTLSKRATVTIQVVEGFISRVRIEGDLSNNAILNGYAREIEAIRPITAKTLERYLLLANDIPGVKVEGILQRSPNLPGAAELAFKTERKIFSGGVSIDNRGSKYLGPLQTSIAASLDNALGLAEQLGINYQTSGNGELSYYGASASIGINSQGTRISLTGSHTRTQPGFDLERIETRGNSDNLGVQISHPFIRAREENLSGFMRLDGRDTENSQLGVVTSEDRIRSARVGINYQVADTWDGINSANLLYSQGLNALGAKRSGSANLSRTAGQSDYQKLNLELQRIQSLTQDVNLVVSASGQYAFDDLLASEQFGLGGNNFGRGYDASEITGDNGIAGSAEVQYNYRGVPYVEVMQPYAFYDAGEISLKTPLASEKKERSLSSTGIGLRLKINDNFSGNLELAQPLTKRIGTENNKDPRFFFGISARY
jgi:hemolysin activation/secretion protein